MQLTISAALLLKFYKNKKFGYLYTVCVRNGREPELIMEARARGDRTSGEQWIKK